MKKLIAVLVIPILLLAMVACSSTTVQTVDNYVNEFLPLLTTVTNLILATEAPGVLAVAQPIEAQVTTDVNLIETQAATITAQNYTSVRQTILALAADAQQNEGALLTACHISNPATLQKVTALVALGNAVIQDIVNALPANASEKQIAIANVEIGNVMSNYKHEYNRIISAKTGDKKVNAVLAKSKKFRHWYLVKAY